MADKGLTMKQGFTRALEDYRKIGDAEMIAFFEKRLEQACKKSNSERKLTPHQMENEKIKTALLENMEAGRNYTVSDLFTYFAFIYPSGMTVNRLVQLLTQLKNAGAIVRSEIKGKAYFAIA